MTWKFLPPVNPLPEDAGTGDRVTPMLPPEPQDAPETRVRVSGPEDAWERQVGEGEDAWAKFLAYRDAPRPRRMIRPGAGNTAALYKIADEWKWFDRVRAYDNYLDRVRQREIDEWNKQDAKEVAAEYMAICRDLRELWAIESMRLLERCKKQSVDGTLKPTELFRMAELIMKYDRLFRNQSTENVGLPVPEANLEHMSIEELREANTLAMKMTKGEKK